MARSRMIKPEIYTDSKTGKLSPLAFKLFLGFLNYADDFGVIRLDLDEFKIRIMPYYSESIEQAIGKPLYEELIPLNLIMQFTVNGKSYLFINNFYEHQYIQHPAKPLLPGWERNMTPDAYANKIGVKSVEISLSLMNPHEDSCELMRTHEKTPQINLKEIKVNTPLPPKGGLGSNGSAIPKQKQPGPSEPLAPEGGQLHGEAEKLLMHYGWHSPLFAEAIHGAFQTYSDRYPQLSAIAIKTELQGKWRRYRERNKNRDPSPLTFFQQGKYLDGDDPCKSTQQESPADRMRKQLEAP